MDKRNENQISNSQQYGWLSVENTTKPESKPKLYAVVHMNDIV